MAKAKNRKRINMTTDLQQGGTAAEDTTNAATTQVEGDGQQVAAETTQTAGQDQAAAPAADTGAATEAAVVDQAPADQNTAAPTDGQAVQDNTAAPAAAAEDSGATGTAAPADPVQDTSAVTSDPVAAAAAAAVDTSAASAAPAAPADASTGDQAGQAAPTVEAQGTQDQSAGAPAASPTPDPVSATAAPADQAAAATPAPAPATGFGNDAVDAVFPKLDLNGQQLFRFVLERYAPAMRPRVPVTPEAGARLQVGLFRALCSFINNADDDVFHEAMEALLSVFEQHGEGIFHQARAFRFTEHMELSKGHRDQFCNLMNLFILTAPKHHRHAAKRQVDPALSMNGDGLTPAGKTRLLGFYEV